MELIEMIWNNYFRGGGAINLTFLTEEYKEKQYNTIYQWNNYIYDIENDDCAIFRFSDGLDQEIYLMKYVYLNWLDKRRNELNKLISNQFGA